MCGKKICHTRLAALKEGEKHKKPCVSCAAKIVNSRPGHKEAKNKHLTGLLKGEKNPFYGKKHTADAISKISFSSRHRDFSYLDTEECKAKTVHCGKDNGMYGKSYQEVWIEKFGIEVAAQKIAELNLRKSQNASGSKNPMYGRPAPHGSGGGWSGWYKGWFFRSLRELVYMITVIEREGHSWVSAEKKALRVGYIDEGGQARNYYADFFLDGKVLVEIKPEPLTKTIRNKLKAVAAEKFCKGRGYEYRIVHDVDLKAAKDDIIKLYNEKRIRFVSPKVVEKMEKLAHNQS
jgi:hypothetical protein